MQVAKPTDIQHKYPFYLCLTMPQHHKPPSEVPHDFLHSKPTQLHNPMKNALTFRLLTIDELDQIAALGQQLNPTRSLEELKSMLREMFGLGHYTCFGVVKEGKIVGISSAWTTIRFYSGKQLEVDNVIIDPSLQSQGIGKQFFEWIEQWAKSQGYKTIELNTYVQNAPSHKFYFNLGYSILGFHFWKRI